MADTVGMTITIYVIMIFILKTYSFNAAVNGHLELPLLKGRQRFDAVSTSNLEVYNVGIGES